LGWVWVLAGFGGLLYVACTGSCEEDTEIVTNCKERKKRRTISDTSISEIEEKTIHQCRKDNHVKDNQYVILSIVDRLI
jgi:hypothetical protein